MCLKKQQKSVWDGEGGRFHYYLAKCLFGCGRSGSTPGLGHGTAGGPGRGGRQGAKLSGLAFGVAGLFGLNLGSGVSVAAVVTDGSLGAAATLDGPQYAITQDLGARAGDNLFHSFSEFSIDVAESATFTGDAGIEYVISRVTGGTASSIDGLLRSEIPGADFLLVNPAGVLFGPSAQVDVPAAFHLGTAAEVRFADGARFSALSPEGSRLSVAPPEAFGFVAGGAGELRLEGSSLSFADRSGVTLAGGDLTVTGAEAVVKDGRLVLTAMGDGDRVLLLYQDQSLEGLAGALTLDGAYLDVSGGGDGVLQAAGDRIRMTQSGLYNYNGGETTGGGRTQVEAGHLLLDASWVLNAAEAAGDAPPMQVRADGLLRLQNGTQAGGFTLADGQSAALEVSAGRIDLMGGSTLYNSTVGSGDAGAVSVRAGRIRVDGIDQAEDAVTGITSQALEATGNAGAVTIEVDGLFALKDGGVVSNGSFSDGDAGAVTIRAGRLVIDGRRSDDVTGISSQANEGAGNAGQVWVEVNGPAWMLGGGQVTSSTFTPGDAGEVIFGSQGLFVHGAGWEGVTGIYSTAESGSGGDAGAVGVLSEGRVVLRNGGQISTNTDTAGDAGALLVWADSLLIADGARGLSTGIVSETGAGGGNGGIVEVDVDGLVKVYSGGQISSSTHGAGQAGEVRVYAKNLAVHGWDFGVITGIRSEASAGAGDAGEVLVEVGRQLLVDGGGSISSSSYSDGDAGRVRVRAGEAMIGERGEFYLSGIISQAAEGSTGSGGDVSLRVKGDLGVYGVGAVSSETFGDGDAGDVLVQARHVELNGALTGYPAGILSQSNGGAGDGGRVMVWSDALEIRDNGLISSATQGAGDAGRVSVQTGDLLIDASGASLFTGISSQSFAEATGRAGTVQVTVDDAARILAGGAISSSNISAGGAGAGAVLISAGELVADGLGKPWETGVFSETEGVGDAGNVVVSVTGDLVLRAGGALSSSTSGSGDAGNVLVQAERLMVDGADERALTGIRSRAYSAADWRGAGTAGNIAIHTGELKLDHGGSISIDALNAPDPVASQRTHLILVRTDRLWMGEGTEISAASWGRGPAADVVLTATDQAVLDQARITTSARAADGGEIRLGGGVLLLRSAQVTTSVAGETGNGGDIVLDLDGLVMDNGFIQANTAAQGGQGGAISVDAPALIAPDHHELVTGGDQRHEFGVDPRIDVIQAAAPDGVSGEIRLTHPSIDISATLATVSTGYAAAQRVEQNPCEVGGGENPSSLTWFSAPNHGGAGSAMESGASGYGCR